MRLATLGIVLLGCGDFFRHWDFDGHGLLRGLFPSPAQGRGEAQRFDLDHLNRFSNIAHVPS